MSDNSMSRVAPSHIKGLSSTATYYHHHHEDGHEKGFPDLRLYKAVHTECISEECIQVFLCDGILHHALLETNEDVEVCVEKSTFTNIKYRKVMSHFHVFHKHFH